jgi:DNA-directed RNA polymerase subunit RPC12/RpoP
MASRPRTLRVPETANARILGEPFPVQVNHCRTPGCANFGVPARTKRGKTGPSADRDLRYKLTSTAKGQEPAIECKECRGKGAIRSNAAIAEEIARIADYARPLERRFACKTAGCANEGLSIGEHRHLYVKRGYYKTPDNPYYQCKACGRRVLVSRKVSRIHAGNQALAADVFSRISNKSPVSRTVEGAGLGSFADYYTILDFIHRRCREMNGAFTRSFLTGERRLPAQMDIALDSQSLMVNWPSRVQRRTVEMTSCCSVDSASRFILELDVNHDPGFDAFVVNQESAELGDMTRKEAFRRYARFWLTGDEMRSGRSAQRRMGRRAAEQAVGDIQDAFRAANAYADVAEMEIVPGQGPLRDHMLRNGMLVKTGYRTLGHMFVLREILKGAGVERLQVSMDEHLSTIASFMCAFREQIAHGAAHGLLVRYDKDCPIDDREGLYKAAWRRMRAFARARDLEDLEREEVGFEMIRAALDAGDLPEDGWLSHPLPTLQEPNKEVRWITGNPDTDLDEQARLYLGASLGRVDNVFELTRRFMSALERPFYTPSGGWNQVWYGYAPYEPDNVRKYLDIFRAVNNFVHTGKDGATPAMRLGFADRPLEYADILWPGERIPRPRRSRRKGRALKP